MAWRCFLSKYVLGSCLRNISCTGKNGTISCVSSLNVLSSNIVKSRQLSNVTGDYEKLWGAVTGGRGTGRGKKRTKPKDKEAVPTGFGKFGKTWPGLNTPVQVTPQKSKKKYKENYLLKPQMSDVAATRPKKGQAPSSQFAVQRQQSKEMPAWKKAFIGGEKIYGQNLSKRGWSGKTWRGREFGAPEMPATGDTLEDFQSIVLELRRVSNMTPGGRKRSQRAIVVVGNRNGAAGFAVGKGQSGISALKKARNKASKYLYYIDRCEDRTMFPSLKDFFSPLGELHDPLMSVISATKSFNEARSPVHESCSFSLIYHDFVSTHRKTTIRFERKPPGYGLRCHRIIRAVADVLGIEDMRCKITGSTTPISVVRAVFQGLLSQETHDQLAERKGLHVVEFRPENSMRPAIVASPSPQAAKEAEKQRTLEDKDYDFDEIFDPYKGAHRPRKIKL